MSAQRYRNCCFTGWIKPNFDDLDLELCNYMCYGIEKCPKTKRIHYQGYAEFTRKVSRKAAQKMSGDETAHIEKREGTQKEAIEYCKKDGDFHEIGTPKKQGERTDLNKLKDEILNGKKVDDIVLEDPEIYHQYGRTLHKIEEIAQRKQYRSEMTKGIWIFGETGTGKSHYAFEKYSPEDTYDWQLDDNGWQDGYTQQENVIINEFRGELKYSFLLKLIDKWPMNVKRRHRSPIPFTSKKVTITSCLPPEEVFHNLAEKDTLDQLYRRCDVFKLIHEPLFNTRKLVRHFYNPL